MSASLQASVSLLSQLPFEEHGSPRAVFIFHWIMGSSTRLLVSFHATTVSSRFTGLSASRDFPQLTVCWVVSLLATQQLTVHWTLSLNDSLNSLLCHWAVSFRAGSLAHGTEGQASSQCSGLSASI